MGNRRALLVPLSLHFAEIQVAQLCVAKRQDTFNIFILNSMLILLQSYSDDEGALSSRLANCPGCCLPSILLRLATWSES